MRTIVLKHQIELTLTLTGTDGVNGINHFTDYKIDGKDLPPELNLYWDLVKNGSEVNYDGKVWTVHKLED